MKGILILLASCCAFLCNARPSVYTRLTEVNVCWAGQPEAHTLELPAYRDLSEKEWIRLHLSLVEQVLRRRSTTGLSPQQKALRGRSLDDLHQYWIAGNFPHNEVRPYRTPVFIDPYDNFCAVGYLVKASGYEAVSRMIAAQTNLAYVKEMHYPELDQWAAVHGFTRDELAWIQPGYPPDHSVASVGKGVSGKVDELMVDAGSDKLYVGGTFSEVDSSIASQNIAYVTQSASGDYTWHDMGGGTNGPVYAIAALDGKVFAGGAFSMAGTANAGNIAYWENNSWHSAGCLYGSVEDLVVFNGTLYAAGTFDLCGSMSDVNFARWNGSSWEGIPGLSGTVKTMEAAGSRLLLGGNFKYQHSSVNAIAWSENGGFQPFSNAIGNEVQDFGLFKGTVYAVCKRTTTDTTGIMMKLSGNQWISVYGPSAFLFQPLDNTLSLNTLVADGDMLLAGGQFFIAPDLMTFSTNCVDVTPSPYTPGNRYFALDSAVAKMVWFGNELIVGGNFHSTVNFTGTGARLGGIGKRVLSGLSVPKVGEDLTFSVTPNPVTGNLVWLKNNFDASRVALFDLNGRQHYNDLLKNTQALQPLNLPALAPGLYLLQVTNEKGLKRTQKLLIR